VSAALAEPVKYARECAVQAVQRRLRGQLIHGTHKSMLPIGRQQQQQQQQQLSFY